jgi:hypothetical protein
MFLFKCNWNWWRNIWRDCKTRKSLMKKQWQMCWYYISSLDVFHNNWQQVCENGRSKDMFNNSGKSEPDQLMDTNNNPGLSSDWAVDNQIQNRFLFYTELHSFYIRLMFKYHTIISDLTILLLTWRLYCIKLYCEQYWKYYMIAKMFNQLRQII